VVHISVLLSSIRRKRKSYPASRKRKRGIYHVASLLHSNRCSLNRHASLLLSTGFLRLHYCMIFNSFHSQLNLTAYYCLQIYGWRTVNRSILLQKLFSWKCILIVLNILIVKLFECSMVLYGFWNSEHIGNEGAINS
jgi:hypothetical protein